MFPRSRYLCPDLVVTVPLLPRSRYLCPDLVVTVPPLPRSRYLCPDLVEDSHPPPEEEPEPDKSEQPVDPLPEKLLHTARVRLKSDALACTIIGVMVFAVHCSTVSQLWRIDGDWD